MDRGRWCAWRKISAVRKRRRACAKRSCKSRLGKGRLGPETVRAVVAKLEAQDKFWALSSRYADPNGLIVEGPETTISLRLPRKRSITVSLDAAVTSGESTQLPPRAFRQCMKLLKTFIPAHTT